VGNTCVLYWLFPLGEKYHFSALNALHCHLFSFALYFIIFCCFVFYIVNLIFLHCYPRYFLPYLLFFVLQFFYFSVIFNLTPFSFMKPAGFCPFIFTPFHSVLILFELLFFPFALLTFSFTLKLIFTVIFTFMDHQPYFSAQLSLRLNHSDKLQSTTKARDACSTRKSRFLVCRFLQTVCRKETA
jgi:hypothetical protein